jgi:hypothetical protein
MWDSLGKDWNNDNNNDEDKALVPASWLLAFLLQFLTVATEYYRSMNFGALLR